MKRLIIVLFVLLFCALFVSPASAINEKATQNVLEDSTGTVTFTIDGSDSDVDTSKVYDCSTWSHASIQFRSTSAGTLASLSASDLDSNETRVTIQMSTAETPAAGDWTTYDSLNCADDSNFAFKELTIAGARWIRYLVYAQAAAKIDSCGTRSYLRQFFVRNLPQN